MKVKMIKTHNPQDYFEGIEAPDLSETTIEDIDLPEPIAVPLDGGYHVILLKISGRIRVTYRKPNPHRNPLQFIQSWIRCGYMNLRWRLRGYGKK